MQILEWIPVGVALVSLYLVWRLHQLEEALEAIAMRTVVLSRLTGKSDRELSAATLAMLQEDDE
jgi:hypothetical protein